MIDGWGCHQHVIIMDIIRINNSIHQCDGDILMENYRLELRHVSKYFGEVKALEDITWLFTRMPVKLLRKLWATPLAIVPIARIF